MKKKKTPFTFNKEAAISEFNKNKPLYEELKGVAGNILDKALKDSGVKFHSVPSRVKDVDSFCTKIERFQISQPFEEVNDILGLRVICLFLSDIEKIGKLIRHNFTVISEDDKVDNSKLASFGYMSVHFIVKLGDVYNNPLHKDLKDLVFEIQVRTIAMDAWANVSHYLDYKTDQDIPDELKRDFYALSGMFYVADKHFQLFFEQRDKTQEEIKRVFEKGKNVDRLSQPINLDTLRVYSSEKLPNRQLLSQKEDASRAVASLTASGFNTIGQIDRMVDAGMKAYLAWERDHKITPLLLAPEVVIIIIASIFSEAFVQKHYFDPAKAEIMYGKYRKFLKPYKTAP